MCVRGEDTPSEFELIVGEASGGVMVKERAEHALYQEQPAYRSEHGNAGGLEDPAQRGTADSRLRDQGCKNDRHRAQCRDVEDGEKPRQDRVRHEEPSRARRKDGKHLPQRAP